MTCEVIDFTLVDDADAVVNGTIRNNVRRTVRGYLAHVALHLNVMDAQIVRRHVYEDSLAVVRAWSGE